MTRKRELAPPPGREDREPDGRGPATQEGRLAYAIVAGIANTALCFLAAGLVGIATGFAGFGSGRGWEPFAVIGLVGWLGGLSAVLAMTRSVFVVQRLRIAPVVGTCVLATLAAFGVVWAVGGGALAGLLTIAAASGAAAWMFGPAE